MTFIQTQSVHASPFDVPEVTWTPVSPKLASLRRTLLGIWWLVAVLVMAVLTVALGMTGAETVVMVFLTLLLTAAAGWGWFAIGRSVRAWGYTERADDLLLRSGLLRRRLAVVPYGRMQFVDVMSGPLERQFGLASVKLHTAAATTDAHIPGLVPEEAARLRDRLASRGESQAAGL